VKQRGLGLASEPERAELQRLLELPQLQDYADAYMREVIAGCRGDLSLAAAVLGVGRASLYRWVKRLQLPRDASGDQARANRVRALFAATRGKW
jgi:DNA-binding NtrC family response regulator